jgi:hypothetical protein
MRNEGSSKALRERKQRRWRPAFNTEIMPKLYEYFGLVVFFYANEHEPIHVHGEFQGGHAKAEIVLQNGKVLRIVFLNVSGKPPLMGSKMKDFRILVKAKANDIVRRWVDFFVLKKHIKPEIINRKLK